MKTVVFLSYALEEKDKTDLEAIRESLRKNEIPFWEAPTEIKAGRGIADQIRKGVMKCEACVFFMTKRSLKTLWCAAEIGGFWGAGKLVIIYRGEQGANIEKIAPQLGSHFIAENLTTLEESLLPYLKERSEQPSSKLGDVDESDFIVKFLDVVEDRFGPTKESFDRIWERLSWLMPFEESSIFGIRYRHFFQEKRVIAKSFMSHLENRIQSIQNSKQEQKINLILDSGTTIFPIFKLLMNHKDEEEWTDSIRIITNNIPGIFIALRDGRTDEDNPYSKIAFDVHAVSGEPTPAFWALLPKDPEKDFAQILPENIDSSWLTIGVTTGNYAMNDGRTLFVRGPRHRGFKKALMDRSDIIYSLLPLGKMLPTRKNDMNKNLVRKEFRNHKEHCYEEIEIPIVGKDKEYVLITTEREKKHKLYEHWVNVKYKLDELENKHRNVTIKRSLFDARRQARESSEKEEELEMPHERHRKVLKKWFEWPED